LSHVIPNHFSDLTLDDLDINEEEKMMLEGRSVIVKKMRPLPVEAIVRGYIPSTKAEVNGHDENITFEKMQDLVGSSLADQVKRVSLELYKQASEFALSKGIIIADTKFEFGLDEEGELTLIDEILSPDSSRFWPANEYKVGMSPPSFDKQFIRDYLETLDWDKTAPGPHLPDEVLNKSAAKYQEVATLLLD